MSARVSPSRCLPWGWPPAQPRSVRVADISPGRNLLGRIKEVSQLSRIGPDWSVQPNGNFELSQRARGFRTLAVMVLEPDGTFKYLYNGRRERSERQRSRPRRR